MADQEAKIDEKQQISQVTHAIQEISETKAGQIFFRWLKMRCFFERSTISGNAQTYDINTQGSLAQEFQRRIYLEVRRGFTRSAKIKIEIEDQNTSQGGGK